MRYNLANHGVCSTAVDIETDNGNITRLTLHGGCPGLREAVSRLAVGRPVIEVIELLRGIPCGARGTSCPNEVAKVLEEA